MLYPCPMCLGRRVNSPSARILNPPCSFCADTGTVDPDEVCICGRPAVITFRDVQRKTCSRYECGKAILEGKGA